MPSLASERVFENLTRRHIEVLAALDRLEPRFRRRQRLAARLGISLPGVKSLLAQIYASTGLCSMDDVADWWSENKVECVLWVADRIDVTGIDLRSRLSEETA
jgi:hypothetical protein